MSNLRVLSGSGHGRRRDPHERPVVSHAVNSSNRSRGHFSLLLLFNVKNSAGIKAATRRKGDDIFYGIPLAVNLSFSFPSLEHHHPHRLHCFFCRRRNNPRHTKPPPFVRPNHSKRPDYSHPRARRVTRSSAWFLLLRHPLLEEIFLPFRLSITKTQRNARVIFHTWHPARQSEGMRQPFQTNQLEDSRSSILVHRLLLERTGWNVRVIKKKIIFFQTSRVKKKRRGCTSSISLPIILQNCGGVGTRHTQ